MKFDRVSDETTLRYFDVFASLRQPWFQRTIVLGPIEQGYLSEECGTPDFMSPELIAGKYDFGVDVFAMGLTAYVLYTGSYPFNEFTHGEWIPA